MFLHRTIAAAIFSVGLIMIVMARLGQLQIIEYEYFSAQSQGNRIRVQPLPPTRGLIYDRNGAILAENLPSFTDGLVHPTINLDNADPACDLPTIVTKEPCQTDGIRCILNNSFGMLGINAVLVVRKPDEC